MNLDFDAFKDSRESLYYGIDVVERACTISHGSIGDIPDTKSNNVSFMKVESLHPDTRNLLATCDSFICYSVTAKKNLIRVIHTVTGEKNILRAHEFPIVDLKFSDNGKFLCSVDNGPGSNSLSNSNSIVLWEEDSSATCGYVEVKRFNYQAKMVVAHCKPELFVAASDSALISIHAKGGEQVHSMDQESIIDIDFNTTGTHIVVALKNTSDRFFRVYKVQGDLVSGSNIRFERCNFMQDQTVPDMKCLTCISENSVVICKSNNNIQFGYTLELYDFDVNKGTISLTQSITLNLPQYDSKRGKSSSLENLDLECCISKDLNSKPRCVIFGSRKSSYVTVIGVKESEPLPLYHVSLMNIRAPLISMDISTVLGREHHSSEEGEHLEISCFQEEAGDQASIQQYHQLFGNLFDFSKYPKGISISSNLRSPLNGNEAQASSTGKAKTILSMLNDLSKQRTENKPAEENEEKEKLSPVNESTESKSSMLLSFMSRGPPKNEGDFKSLSVSQNTNEGIDSKTIDEATLPSKLPDFVTSFQQSTSINAILGVGNSNEVHSVSKPVSSPTLSTSGSNKLVNPILETPTPISTPTHELLTSVITPMNDLKSSSATITNSLEKISQSMKKLDGKVGDSMKTKEEIANLLKKSSEKIRSNIDTDMKKAVNAALASSDLKKELANAIIADVVPSLRKVIKDTVKESLEETLNKAVKKNIQEAFKTAFETSLVPAYQAGTDKMFTQIQTSFEVGMKEMGKEARNNQVQNFQNYEQLSKRVEDLQSLLLDLKATMVETAKHHASLPHSVAKPEVEAETPFTLLEKGKVNEAIVAALELKDISITVTVLAKIDPAVVTQKCSELVRLCIVQQLAADMSTNTPEEGLAKRVDWVKNLVLSLIGTKDKSEDEVYNRNFKSMIQTVLESIQSANKIIFNSMQDDGEDISVEIPRSVSTDLQLLEFVIQSKI